ncbi:MAG: MBL fold metallo-hydrolase [Candidatus Helarchaeota archaeon]
MYSISSYIRDFSDKLLASATVTVTFLGTGPSDPIKKSGKNGRNNTSTLIKYKNKSYLIDIGKTFDKKTEFDYLLVTHLHSDAFGGIKYIKDREFIFALPDTLSRGIKQEKFWNEQILKINEKNRVGDLVIIPFPVKHDIIYRFPTFGYQFIVDNKKLTYASDMIEIPEKSEKYFNDIDILIADGAGWKSNLSTHFGIWPFMKLVEKKNWNIGKIYFVQIGRSVPDHKEAQKELSEKYNNVFLAYDGMKIKL